MNAAYIGILSQGSTSRMRAEALKALLPEAGWSWIDTEAPFQDSARLWRSLGFRSKRGPAVDRMNDAVREGIDGREFDLVWVDKAVFLGEETMRAVRNAGRRLVHFTADTAFCANRSKNFERSMGLYDLLVTTKSFELGEYHARVSCDKVLLTTQGYDPDVHFPRNGDEDRRREAVFIGFAEPDRERSIVALLEAGVSVRLGGMGWKRFLREWKGHPRLSFGGEQIFGAEYATLLSRAWVGLGLVTKRIPELHTTRTFEIPACGAILATERTSDTSSMFGDDEAIFFDDYPSLAKLLISAFETDDITPLRRMATAGRQRVISDKRDYRSIIASILASPRLVI